MHAACQSAEFAIDRRKPDGKNLCNPSRENRLPRIWQFAATAWEKSPFVKNARFTTHIRPVFAKMTSQEPIVEPREETKRTRRGKRVARLSKSSHFLENPRLC